MEKIGILKMLQTAARIEKQTGLKRTLLGIGPMSSAVIRAAFELAREKDFPLMFIASRNQVDAVELGGGYVCNWDQAAFVRAIAKIARETNFNGLYYVCRDHGGPWQRDNERKAALPEEKAMALALQSYLADLVSGFDLLHIDPTKEPYGKHEKGVVTMEKVIRRTVELIRAVEEERCRRKLPGIAYEIGTEETNGGLTTEKNYALFIKTLSAHLRILGLPNPSFIVGQTGTLTRLTQNVGHFNAAAAGTLAMIARRYGLGLKEHNSDYLEDSILLQHPALGITAANVAPEFGVVETRAWLELARLEADEHKLGRIRNPSRLDKVLSAEAIRCERWRKWMVGGAGRMTVRKALRNPEMAMQITEICGHYTFETPAVKKALRPLTANLEAIGVNAERYVVEKIKASIDRYVICFQLAGLTSGIRRTFETNVTAPPPVQM